MFGAPSNTKYFENMTCFALDHHHHPESYTPDPFHACTVYGGGGGGGGGRGGWREGVYMYIQKYKYSVHAMEVQVCIHIIVQGQVCMGCACGWMYMYKVDEHVSKNVRG